MILDLLLDASDVPTCVLDPGLRFVRFNRACAEITLSRWGKELRPGITLMEIIPDGEYLRSRLEEIRAALSGIPQQRTIWMETRDGTRTLRDVAVVPVRGHEGGVVGVMLTAGERDVPPTTTLPGAGPGIEYRRLFHDAPLPMLLARLDGTILEANRAFGALLGYENDGLVGKEMSMITWPEDRGISPLRALADGSLSRYHVEKRYRDVNDRPVPVGVTAVRLTTVDPPLVLAIAEPLHDHAGPVTGGALPRETAPALAVLAFEAQIDGQALLDDAARTVDVNPAFAEMHGRSRSGCIGLSPKEFEVEQGTGGVARCLEEARRGPVRFRSVHRRADGRTFPVDVAVAPLTHDGKAFYACTIRDITAEETILRERKASEVRYRQLIERSPIVTYSYSTRRGGLYYSPQVEMLLGYAPAELVKHPFRWTESVHPDDRRRLTEALARMEDDGGFDLEVRVRHQDGSWRWIRDWSVNVERLGDELIVTGQALDLTPLREQERRFQRLVENVPDILYRWSRRPEPHFNYLSAAAERVFGYTPEELMADPGLIERNFDPRDWADAMASHDDPSRDQRAYRLRGHHRDGHPIVLEVRRTVIRDRDGEVIAVEGVARDITAAVEAEARNALLSAGLEQAAEVVVITDRTGSIIEVNSAFERVTGYTREEALGRKPSLLKSGFQGEEFYARMWETLMAGQIFRGTVVNRKRDGSNYVAEAVITPIRSPSGEITNFVGLQRDVSRERLLDEALRQSQKMEAVGQVTGGVAHDFNNMLTVILANANLLEGRMEHDAEATATLHEMTAAAQHGTGLVRQLLAFGRKERLSPRTIRLTDEFSAFITIIRRAVTEDIEISFAGHDASWAEVDRTAFEQMVLNLVTNARDAMPQGGRLSIRTAERVVTEAEAAMGIGDRRPGRYTTISITDTGKGMPPEVLRRIFEPFYTTKPVGKGTGLGLSMVYGLMQQHGGWVDVTSAVGIGSTVTLGFPVVPAPAKAEPRAATAAPEGPVGRGELILVVEDEDALRRVTIRTLQNEGFKVIAAADGEAAWNQWQEHGDAIALVLTDAVMPKLGGPELIRRLATHGCGVPVILMSGYAAEGLSDPGLAHIPVVAKPWSGAALARRIREVLDAKMDGGAA